MSFWSRILILVANLLIKEMIYGDYLLVVVIYVNRRSVQLPVLPPFLVTFAVQLLVRKSEKSGRGRRKKDQILAEYGNDWRPVGVDLKGFNIDLLAPGTIYDSKQTYLNRRLCKKEEGSCAAAMDAILATAFKFQLTVWPSINAQSSVFSYKNYTRAYRV